MKVAKLMAYSGYGQHQVIKATDGKYYKFLATPYREITENDLEEVPYYSETGTRSEEASEWRYIGYGLTK